MHSLSFRKSNSSHSQRVDSCDLDSIQCLSISIHFIPCTQCIRYRIRSLYIITISMIITRRRTRRQIPFLIAMTLGDGTYRFIAIHIDIDMVTEVRTMRFLLIGQNRSIFIGNLGLFWICFDRIIGNA